MEIGCPITKIGCPITKIGYPIMIIITNQECSHCINMRGKDGWPSDDNKVFDEHENIWNEKYFKDLLKAGFSEQTTRVIEISYDKLNSNPKIKEFTFFDLDRKSLIIKKYIKGSHNEVVLKMKNGSKNDIKIEKLSNNFDTFVEKYIPVLKIKRYLHVYPLRLFFHSQIWFKSIENGEPLYGRVQGYRTIRCGNNYKEFKILRSSSMDPREKERNPVDILHKLISYELYPLRFPSDD